MDDKTESVKSLALGLESLSSLMEEFNWNTHADEVNSKYATKQ